MKQTSLLICLIASAQIAAAGVDPQAEKILRQFSDFYRKLDSFQVDYVSTMEHKSETRANTKPAPNEKALGLVVVRRPLLYAVKPTVLTMDSLTMQRPNKLSRFNQNAGYGYSTDVCDGKKLFYYQFRSNKLTVEDAPADFDGMFGAVTNGLHRIGPLFVDNLLRNDPYVALVDELDACEYLGTSERDGIMCHRLRFVEERCDHEMWIETGDKPLLRFVMEGMPKRVLAIRRDNLVLPIDEVVSSFTNWRLNPRLPADTFQLSPPASMAASTPRENTCSIEMPPGYGRPPGIQTNGLHQVWWKHIFSPDVVGDPQRHLIYTIEGTGECVTLNAAGQTVSTVSLTNISRNSHFRLARLTGNAEPDLVAFTADSVEAFDGTGRPLWRYPVFGVLDVTTCDLDGDGFDEVIVGGIGSAGLRVLDRAGKLRWQNTALGIVWHVSAEKTKGVVAVAADGKIHVFRSDGQQRSVLDAGCYASAAGLVRDEILVAGMTDKAGMLVALDSNGERKWSAKLTDQRTLVHAIAVATSQPWVAVLLFGGEVQVYHTETGARLARFNSADTLGSISWLDTDTPGGPLLLFANSAELWVYGLDTIPGISHTGK